MNYKFFIGDRVRILSDDYEEVPPGSTGTVSHRFLSSISPWRNDPKRALYIVTLDFDHDAADADWPYFTEELERIEK